MIVFALLSLSGINYHVANLPPGTALHLLSSSVIEKHGGHHGCWKRCLLRPKRSGLGQSGNGQPDTSVQYDFGAPDR